MLRSVLAITVASSLTLIAAPSATRAQEPDQPEAAAEEEPATSSASGRSENLVRPNGSGGGSSALVNIGTGLISLGVIAGLVGGFVALQGTCLGWGCSPPSIDPAVGYGIAIAGAVALTAGVALVIVGAIRNGRRDDPVPEVIPTAAVLDDGSGLVVGASGYF